MYNYSWQHEELSKSLPMTDGELEMYLQIGNANDIDMDTQAEA